MQSYTYLIIGGGIAGTTAAETIRQQDANGSIAIVTEEPFPLYSRVMLSKPAFFLEKVPFDNIFLKKEEWYTEKNITLLSGKTAAKLDPGKKIVTLEDDTELGYEKLLLATGTSPRKCTISGAGRGSIFSVKSIEDIRYIFAAKKNTKHAVVIGGGFISFEMCDMLRLAGIEVTSIILEHWFLQPMLDKDGAEYVERAMEKAGVKIMRRSKVKEIKGDTKSIQSVIIESLDHGEEKELECQMVIAGIGVVCELEWLKEAGIKVGHGIMANEYLETNLPNIWAAGDIAEFNDVVVGEHVQLGNWANAMSHGRTAGTNMVGKEHKEFRMVSFYTSQGLGVTVAFVGNIRPLPSRAIVCRTYPGTEAHTRFLILGKEMVGASMVNKTDEMSAITNIIMKDIDVSDHLSDLADPKFDLKQLVS